MYNKLQGITERAENQVKKNSQNRQEAGLKSQDPKLY